MVVNSSSHLWTIRHLSTLHVIASVVSEPDYLAEVIYTVGCRIRVLDAKALGDPGVLGTAEVSLKEAELQPNAGARNTWLPLKVCQHG